MAFWFYIFCTFFVTYADAMLGTEDSPDENTSTSSSENEEKTDLLKHVQDSNGRYLTVDEIRAKMQTMDSETKDEIFLDFHKNANLSEEEKNGKDLWDEAMILKIPDHDDSLVTFRPKKSTDVIARNENLVFKIFKVSEELINCGNCELWSDMFTSNESDWMNALEMQAKNYKRDRDVKHLKDSILIEAKDVISSVTANPGLFFDELQNATEEEWRRLGDKLVEKLEANAFKKASFKFGQYMAIAYDEKMKSVEMFVSIFDRTTHCSARDENNCITVQRHQYIQRMWTYSVMKWLKGKSTTSSISPMLHLAALKALETDRFRVYPIGYMAKIIQKNIEDAERNIEDADYEEILRRNDYGIPDSDHSTRDVTGFLSTEHFKKKSDQKLEADS